MEARLREERERAEARALEAEARLRNMQARLREAGLDP